jgi:hypothetical protein
MPEQIRLVCLANSKKHRGRCVAGIEIIDGLPNGWVRPVTDRSGHSLFLREIRFQDESYPAPMDVIELRLLQAVPSGFQSENWLVDDALTWEKVGVWSWEGLEEFESEHSGLWGTGSSQKGCNDRVVEAAANAYSHSLALIQLSQLTMHVLDGGYQEGKREVRASFSYLGTFYDLRVSDPTYESHYLGKPDGDYVVASAYLTISLAEPFHGYCYKVVAAIIEPDNR